MKAIRDMRDATAYDALHKELRNAGITLTAGLPDDWTAPLIDQLEADSGITNVRVARESEAFTICTGAFFGGVHAAAIVGGTGFLTCISEIASLNLRYQIPLLVIASLRGGVHDHQVFQEVQGRTLLKISHSLDLPSTIVDRREKIDLIPQSFKHSRVQKRPHVVWLTKALITGNTSEY